MNGTADGKPSKISSQVASVTDPADYPRLAKELAKAEKDLAGVERTLANEGFVAKAAPAVIEKKRAQAAELTATIEQLKAQIADFA